MPEALLMLAGAVASALARATDTPLWPALRDGVAEAVDPVRPGVPRLRLEKGRRALVSQHAVRREPARAAFTAEWRDSLHEVLLGRPEAATGLRRALAEVSPSLPRWSGQDGVVPPSVLRGSVKLAQASPYR
ncbi:hypothetical protein [Actinosynnema pretiosum]|uniref:Uncharacterized protein n=1 Tax=Actinosynnema pretiosum TaxID=42197 RepID=A0A290ZF59_9PSEU|nr:hypothetical protein [Actinosynnema pretiosum]ATE57680.1 hypothetical protein CNX65_33840 [Actinosynnema pretiosum]